MGSRRIPWRVFSTAAANLFVIIGVSYEAQNFDQNQSIGYSAQWILMLGVLCQVLNPATAHFDLALRTTLTLDNLLDKSGQSKATDPRDKVFALPNIASDALSMNLLADYNMTLEEVYITVARLIVALEGDLAILGFADNTAWEQNSLPSWVPDEDMCSKELPGLQDAQWEVLLFWPIQNGMALLSDSQIKSWHPV